MSVPGSPFTVAVVGGGFSGVTVVANLVRRRAVGGGRAARTMRVAVFEASGTLARGAAYGTTDDRHLLNVPAARMGAWADAPGDFHAWLNARGAATGAGEFVPRTRYASYLADIWERTLREAPGAGVEVEVCAARVNAMEPASGGFVLADASGAGTRCDAVVLCTGHLEPDPPDVRHSSGGSRVIANPWRPGAIEAIGPDEHVGILGTGLTMLDVLLTLVGRGHQGPITAVSRHGRLPRAHRADPLSGLPTFDPAPSVGVLSSPLAALRWVRGRIESLDPCAGGAAHWTHVIDALRPHTHGAWLSWSTAERERFVRHLRPLWDVHRHRVDPALIRRVEALTREGRLSVRAGRVRAWREESDGVVVEVHGGTSGSESLRFGRLIVCTGPNPDIARGADPLMRSLLKRGLVVRDPLGLGALCEPPGSCRLKSAAGEPRALFCVGPLRRADLWESIAVPELRAQADEAAAACLEACGRAGH